MVFNPSTVRCRVSQLLGLRDKRERHLTPYRPRRGCPGLSCFSRPLTCPHFSLPASLWAPVTMPEAESLRGTRMTHFFRGLAWIYGHTGTPSTAAAKLETLQVNKEPTPSLNQLPKRAVVTHSPLPTLSMSSLQGSWHYCSNSRILWISYLLGRCLLIPWWFFLCLSSGETPLHLDWGLWALGD